MNTQKSSASSRTTWAVLVLIVLGLVVLCKCSGNQGRGPMSQYNRSTSMSMGGGVATEPWPTGIPTSTPNPNVTPVTPTQALSAEITMSIHQVIPCSSWEGHPKGCLWNYTVTFRNTSSVPFTIQRLRVYYRDRSGNFLYGEHTQAGWFDYDRSLPAHGTASYSSWVRTDPTIISYSNPIRQDLAGGTIYISYEGRDTLGHTITGSITAELAKP